MEESEAEFHCCVPSCTATSDNTRTVSFHSFPSDKRLQKEWIAALQEMELYSQIIQIEGNDVVESLCICSRHFTQDDFKTNKTESNNSVPLGQTRVVRRSLNNDAVPSIFPVTNANPSGKMTRRRPSWKRTSVIPSLGTTRREITVLLPNPEVRQPGEKDKRLRIRTKTNIAQVSSISKQNFKKKKKRQQIRNDSPLGAPSKMMLEKVVQQMQQAVSSASANVAFCERESRRKNSFPSKSESGNVTSHGFKNIKHESDRLPLKRLASQSKVISKKCSKSESNITELSTKKVALKHQLTKPSEIQASFTNIISTKIPQVSNLIRPRRQNIQNAHPERKKEGSIRSMLSEAITKVFSSPTLENGTSRRKGNLGSLFPTGMTSKKRGPFLGNRKLRKSGRFTSLMDADIDVELDDSVDHDSYSNHLTLPTHELLNINVDDDASDDNEEVNGDPLDTQNTCIVSNIKLEEVDINTDGNEQYDTPLFNGFGLNVDETNSCVVKEESEFVTGDSEQIEIKPDVTAACKIENNDMNYLDILTKVEVVEDNQKTEPDISNVTCTPDHSVNSVNDETLSISPFIKVENMEAG